VYSRTCLSGRDCVHVLTVIEVVLVIRKFVKRYFVTYGTVCSEAFTYVGKTGR